MKRIVVLLALLLVMLALLCSCECKHEECSPATCTEASLCLKCNAEVAPALGHSEGIDAAVSATCTEAGLAEGKHCSVCNAVIVAQEVVPAFGHTEVVDAAVAPTCTEAGLTEGKHCSVCNAVIVAQEVAPALGHTEVIDTAVTPTCIINGKTEGTHCVTCGNVLLAQKIIYASGHDVAIDVAVAPSCTQSGLTEGTHCPICNTILIPQKIINPTGHTEVIDAAIASTCTETGLTEGKHCSVCEAILTVQEITDALGHENSDWLISTPPTYTENGLRHKVCSVCQTSWGEEPVYAIMYTTGSDGLEYRFIPSKNAYTLTGIGTCTEKDIIIPAYYNNLPVTKIASRAFYGIKLTSLVVPHTVEEIESSAFEFCDIEDITLNEGLRIIGSDAFTSLDEYVSIPSTVTYVGEKFYTYQGARTDGFSGITFLGDCPTFSEYAFQTFGQYYLYDPTREGWPEAGGEIQNGTFYPIGWVQDAGETSLREQQDIYNQSVFNLANTLYLSDSIQWAEHMRIVTNNEELQAFIELSDEICRGLTTDDEKIRAIYNWVVSNIEYDISYRTTNLPTCLADKKAVCAQYVMISIQLMRLQNIPAVYVSGLMNRDADSIRQLAKLAEGDSDYSHAWLLAYNGERWIQMDPTWDVYDFDYLESHIAYSVEGITDIRNEKMQYNCLMHIVYTDDGMRILWTDANGNQHKTYLGSHLHVMNFAYSIRRGVGMGYHRTMEEYENHILGQYYNQGWFTTNYGKTVYCLIDGRNLMNGTYLIDGEYYTFEDFFLVEQTEK